MGLMQVPSITNALVCWDLSLTIKFLSLEARDFETVPALFSW